MQFNQVVQIVQRNWWQCSLIVVGLGLMGVGFIQAKQDSVGDTLVIIHPSPSPSPVLSSLVVDVAGAVEKPGVYRLSSGSRIGDALIAAGGLNKRADRDYVAKQMNQAALITDGMKVYVPEVGSVISNGQTQVSIPTVGVRVISINTATESELDSLWGVGEARVKTIIENRPYRSWEEFKQKTKITQEVIDKNQGKIGL
jgi:DNA uptake protein ComE-like DNA-binding protein